MIPPPFLTLPFEYLLRPYVNVVEMNCHEGRSGSPKDICILRITDRYVLMVCGARFLSAKKEAKEHKIFSVTGNGCDRLN